MSKGKFNHYEHQQLKQKGSFRHNDSLVAVNPERITTLLELAMEHYGKQCVRCGSKKRLSVHHRHYRTIGFEKPERDIVLLCWNCNEDIHKRARQKKLNRDDIPYVNPLWTWLAKVNPVQEQPEDRSPMHLWWVVFADPDGTEWAMYDFYRDKEGKDSPERLGALITILIEEYNFADVVDIQDVRDLTLEQWRGMEVE